MMKRGKRMAAVVLSLALAVSSVGMPANRVAAVEAGQGEAAPQAAVSVWDGTVDISWYTGDKTSYDISTAAQLAGLSQIVGTVGDEYRFVGVTINLVSDIVLNDTSNWMNWKAAPPANVWTPIGAIGSPVMGHRPFAGCFNGNGHTISGMYVDRSNFDGHGGLFTYTSGAVIKNVKIEKSVVISRREGNSAGCLAGVAESTYFDQCSAENVIVTGAGLGDVGGLVGTAKRVNVVTSFMEVALMGFGILVNPLVFKAVESGNASGTYFSQCTVVGAELSATYSWGMNKASVGGIVGKYSAMDGIISNCGTSAITASSIDTIKYGGTAHTGDCGGIYGSIGDDAVVVIDACFTNAFKRADPGTSRSDAAYVPEL